jgi:hypothetical protein
MIPLSIRNPYPLFTDLLGQPLEAGYVYIGEANLNPITDQLETFFDENLLYPAVQPIRTINGYPSRSGTPSAIFINSITNDGFSILVKNKSGETVFFDPNITDYINYFSSEVVNVKHFGAVGDGIIDDTAAILEAVDYADTTNRGNILFFPKGLYVTSAAIEISTKGMIIRGAGPVSTRILGSHTDGDVVRFKREYSLIEDIEVSATGSRLTATNTTGIGIRIEYDDIPSTSDVRTRMCQIRNVIVFNHPATGIVYVGPETGGSRIESCRIKNNRGHGISIDRGYLTGRTNISAEGAPGLLNIEDCLLQDNGGHGLAMGHPSDPLTTPVLRVLSYNLEVGGNAFDAGVRYSNHQVWGMGTNHEIHGSVFKDNSSGLSGGIELNGRNHLISNNRFIDIDHSIHLADDTSLPTQGITIQGLTVLDRTQDPAIIVDSGVENVKVTNLTPSNITTLITPDVPGAIIDFVPQIVYKKATQTVNNSSTLVNDDDLKFYLQANKFYYFECNIENVSGSTAPDIKVAFTVPSGTTMHWCAIGGIKVDATDTIVSCTPVTSSGATTDFVSRTSNSLITIVGFADVDNTAGYLQLRWAQNTATAVNTNVINRISTLKVWQLY